MNRTFASATAVALLSALAACDRKDTSAQTTPDPSANIKAAAAQPHGPVWKDLTIGAAVKKNSGMYGAQTQSIGDYLDALTRNTADGALRVADSVTGEDLEVLFAREPYASHVIRAKMFADVEDLLRSCAAESCNTELTNFGALSRKPGAPAIPPESMDAARHLLSKLQLDATDENARDVALNAEVRFNLLVEAHAEVNNRRRARGEEPAPLL